MKNRTLIVLAIATIVTLKLVVFVRDTRDESTPEITWRIENDTLFISGKGVIPATMIGKWSAWHKYRSEFHSINIEEGITFVGQNVFYRYKNITSLTVAGSVKELAPNSFNSCKNLTTVEMKGAIPPDVNVRSFYRVKFNNVKLIVPAGTNATYEADPFWSKFATIEESTQPPTEQLVAVEPLTIPCVVQLKRTANIMGCLMKVKVFLNGVEQTKKLISGQTIEMGTDRVQNVLYLQHGKEPIAVRRFDATAGGEIRIEYSYFFAYMEIKWHLLNRYVLLMGFCNRHLKFDYPRNSV